MHLDERQTSLKRSWRVGIAGLQRRLQPRVVAVDVFEERDLTGVRPDNGRRVED